MQLSVVVAIICYVMRRLSYAKMFGFVAVAAYLLVNNHTVLYKK